MKERTSPCDWDTWYLRITQAVAVKSKDPSTQVGALLVRGQRPLSFGYNGFPRGVPDWEQRWERPQKYAFVVHAELNAIVNAQQSLAGATLYLTHRPCGACAKAIIQAGIVRVVVGPGQLVGDHDLDLAEALLGEGGVEVVHHAEG